MDKPTGLGSHKRRALRALRNSQTLPFNEEKRMRLAGKSPIEQSEDSYGEQNDERPNHAPDHSSKPAITPTIRPLRLGP